MQVLEREAHAALVLDVELGVLQQAVERAPGGQVALDEPGEHRVARPGGVGEAAVAARGAVAAAGRGAGEPAREAGGPAGHAVGPAGEARREGDAGAAGDEAIHQTVTASRTPISRSAASAVKRRRSSSATSDTQATCGVSSRFGASSSGLASGSGSTSVTSSAAPAR